MKAENIIEGLNSIRAVASSKGWKEVHKSVLPKIAEQIKTFKEEKGIESFMDEILTHLELELSFIFMEHGEEKAMEVASQLTELTEEDIVKVAELRGWDYVSERMNLNEEVIEKWADRLNLKVIGETHKLSSDFRERFKDDFVVTESGEE